MYTWTNGAELYHHGIKGQKWGVRRYQRKDGSLTRAGKLHYADNEEFRKKVDAERSGKSSGKSSVGSSGKNLNEMSTAELNDYRNRLTTQRDILTLQTQISSMTPKKVNKGQEIVDKLMKESVLPALTNAGKSYLEKFLKNKLGLNETDVLTKLEKEYKKLDLEKKINDLKNPKKDDVDETSKLRKEWEKLDLEKKISDLKNPKDDPLADLRKEVDRLNLEKNKVINKNTIEKQQQEMNDRAKAKYQEEVDSYNRSKDESRSTDGYYRKVSVDDSIWNAYSEGRKIAGYLTDGSSSSPPSSSSSSSKIKDFVDVEWKDITTSSQTSFGKSIISGLLEAPKSTSGNSSSSSPKNDGPSPSKKTSDNQPNYNANMKKALSDLQDYLNSSSEAAKKAQNSGIDEYTDSLLKKKK